MIQVYYQLNMPFGRGYKAGDKLEPVPTPDWDFNPESPKAALEALYCLFNNGGQGEGHRSMSVGDVIVLGETAWSCEAMGWKVTSLSADDIVVTA